MDFRDELKGLLHKIMLKELSKTKTVIDKDFEDSYYGHNVSAVVYAKYLLSQYGIIYPVCFDYDKNGIVYYDQETIDNMNSELFDKVDRLFDEGKINKFEKTRLVNALEFLYDENMLQKDYYQSERYEKNVQINRTFLFYYKIH